MAIDSSNRTVRRVIALAIIALVVAVGVLAAPSTQGQASTYKTAVAPVSAQWTEYLEAKALGSVASRTVDGRALGAMPSLLNPALTRGMQVDAGLVGAYPASFDLRSSGRVSPVKNQSSFGTCWSFATYGSLESWLLPGELRDYSEDNLVLNSGFGTSSATAATLYDMGGNLQMSTAYLTRWGGPVYESDDAYGDSLTPGGLTALKHVQQVDWIPARASATDNANIKSALTNIGALYVSMYFAGSSSGSTYYKASTASYYYNGTSTSGNHAVVIVGWDDNYAASNFATNPGANGAFIVKNSWGTGWGNAGYFYVSYYDSCFGRVDELAAFDNAESTTNYTGIYQYDPLGCVTSMYYGSGSSGVGWFANVFTAASTTKVPAVGFYTLYPGTSYEIYTGSTLAGKTLNTSGTASYMGYHTVTLSTPLNISQGQNFVVAVKVVTPASVTDTNKYPIAIEYPATGFSEKATAAAGQSFISTNGTSWVDLTGQYAKTNTCVKAYTGTGAAPVSYTLTTTIGTGSGTIGRSPNQTTFTAGTQVTLTATPSGGYTFTSWSGGATGTTNPVVVTMDGDKTVTANFQANGPTPTRYEQNNALLVYAGTWSTSNSASYSGSSYKTTNTAGAKVTAAFTGTSVSYIARTSTNLGIAKVTLDGVVYYADLYSSSTKYKQTVWSKTDLVDGPHTLVIERNGTRTSPSTGYTINLDALDIVGTLTAVGPAPVSYTLTTTIGTGSGTIGRSPNQTTFTAGSQVTLTATASDGYTFTGWSGGATGTTNPVVVTMDGDKTVTANFQSSGGPVTYTLTTTVGAGSGSISRSPDLLAYDSGASVQLTAVPADGYIFTGWSGALTGSSNPATVTMNGNKTVTATFALAGSAVTRYEQDNPFFVYTGNWSTTSSTSFSGGSFAYTNYSGAKVTVRFTGTAVKYIARTGTTSGKAKVTLDGVIYTVDLYSSGSMYKKAVWTATGLTATDHTLTIEFTGTRNPLSSASTVNLDALDVTGTLLAP